MLINTLVLWLKDLTPVFVASALFLSLLLSKTSNMQVKKPSSHLISFIFSIVSGVFLACVMVLLMDKLSQLFEYKGYEIIITCCYLLLFIGFIFYILTRKPYWIIVSLSILVAIKLVSFITYFSLYYQNSELFQAKSYGLFLAAGITTSLSILLFLVLEKIKEYYSIKIVFWLTIIFVAGQLNLITPLLIQVDLISDMGSLWDTSTYIQDDSEYGLLLKSLIGYEATPSIIHLMVFVSVLILSFLAMRYSKGLNFNASSIKGQHYE